jgi:hypothetical protein
MTEINDDKPIGAAAAAALMGLASSTLAKMRCLGGGPPFIKAGRKVLYRPADVADWLNARLVQNTCEAALSLPPRLAKACSKAAERSADK